jgi:hypothetical protein
VRLGAYNAHSHDSCLQNSHIRTAGLGIEVLINSAHTTNLRKCRLGRQI